MLSRIRKLMHDAKDAGASAVEYGLLIAGIAVLVMGAVFALGQIMQDDFNDVANQISNGPTSSN